MWVEAEKAGQAMFTLFRSERFTYTRVKLNRFSSHKMLLQFISKFKIFERVVKNHGIINLC